MPSVEGLPARRAALQILDRVLRSGLTVSGASQQFTSSLPANDRALALAIVGETIRRIPQLDALIDSATRQRIPDDSKARMVLRLALAQKLKMHVPDHAIIATALPLVDGGPRRLVHGVLGTLLRRPLSASESPALPQEAEQRWRKAWGDEIVDAAQRQIVQRAPLDLTFADDSEARAYAGDHGGVSLARHHVRLASSAVAELSGFEAGRWWVQDLAASLPARLVPADAKSVLDACAAPGGKTMQLAAAGHQVLALDDSRSRAQRMAENLARTGLKAEIALADAFEWDAPRPFDAILLDAPCSATGTFRRHPEVLYRVRTGYIHDAADRQLRLLSRAREWVKPGGAIVYSVCSLEPQEGEGVIRDFLAGNPDYQLQAPRPDELPDFAAPSAEGWVRILPGQLEQQGGLDGFFMARLVGAG